MKHFQLQPADGRPCFGSTLLRAQVSLLHRHQFSSFSCRIVWIKCFGVLTVHDKTFRDNPLPNPAVWSLGPRLEKPKWGGGGAPAFFSCFSGPVVHSLVIVVICLSVSLDPVPAACFTASGSQAFMLKMRTMSQEMTISSAPKMPVPTLTTRPVPFYLPCW